MTELLTGGALGLGGLHNTWVSCPREPFLVSEPTDSLLPTFWALYSSLFLAEWTVSYRHMVSVYNELLTKNKSNQAALGSDMWVVGFQSGDRYRRAHALWMGKEILAPCLIYPRPALPGSWKEPPIPISPSVLVRKPCSSHVSPHDMSTHIKKADNSLPALSSTQQTILSQHPSPHFLVPLMAHPDCQLHWIQSA
jgi:hypothetical protein